MRATAHCLADYSAHNSVAAMTNARNINPSYGQLMIKSYGEGRERGRLRGIILAEPRDHFTSFSSDRLNWLVPLPNMH